MSMLLASSPEILIVVWIGVKSTTTVEGFSPVTLFIEKMLLEEMEGMEGK
jgi:hypothetical protein